ncbi:MAG: class I SAM-dependent methyltransferase [Candidatus Terrybacteria bacterium]|nr:class I SAM-dependent methyltransferase [Candidatus Terrybacteria bacterium]
MSKHRIIRNERVYLARMSRPMQEKLRVAKYIPQDARTVLDVGCANGAITIALAKLFPQKQFFGIDLHETFVKRAQESAAKEGIKNIQFEQIYLRDLLARPGRFGAVIFVSVLHEFYAYGEGISSVLKALADAHELLRRGGEIVIRDMILHEYAKHTSFQVDEIIAKVRARRPFQRRTRDFERAFGKMSTLYQLNHFLLKYMYEENWPRECRDHYVPVTFEQYEQLLDLLGMELQLEDSYLIDFLRAKWKRDFGLTDEELEGLRSTGFLAAKKV